MQIDIVGRHLALGADQREHAENEAHKLGKFFDGINEVRIRFEREHLQLKTEIVCAVSGGRTLVAVEKGSTVHESLEFASDNMARQIKKYKDKLHERRHPKPADEETRERPAADDAMDDAMDDLTDDLTDEPAEQWAEEE